jgi:predicted HAD superfamily Cof-like phosphohydrolase
MSTLYNIHEWFQKAVPQPTGKNLAVQTGVHLEEVCEFVREMRTNDLHARALIKNLNDSLNDLADYLKTKDIQIEFPDPVETLDALCDQIVTSVGIGYMLDMDVPGGTEEVTDSNWSKFVDYEPQFDENGKIDKGPDYFKPDLTSYV